MNLKYRNVVSTFDKERENNKKTIEQTKKYADGLARERDLVRKELVKCISKTQKKIVSVNFLIFLLIFLRNCF